MIKRFREHIEREPWDEEIMQHEKILNIVSIGIIILGVIYFGPVCLNVFMR